jgi:phosphoenolpyruvate-protein phosphotransferase (PTS system enzyme I)
MDGRGASEARSIGEIRSRGVPASPGLAHGPAHVVLHEEGPTEERTVSARAVRSELRKFRVAVRRARDEIAALKECLIVDPDDPGTEILDAHLMLLEDPEVLGAITRLVEAEKLAADSAVRRIFRSLASQLEATGVDYLRSRVVDLRDVKRRILRHLGIESEPQKIPNHPVILIARDLPPSETAAFDRDRILAFVTDHGGPTSHVAILARSRGIPAVVGTGDISGYVKEGDLVLVDGGTGDVIVRPGVDEKKRFQVRRLEREKRIRAADSVARKPAMTLDGREVVLLANIETPEDAVTALDAGADGVGLYRTEFFFIREPRLPDEEMQARVYRQAVRRMRGRPVTIRTMDLGGDKLASYLGTSREDNPFLGMRGIRFSLAHPDIFRTQIRAIYRASAIGKVRIMLPMVSCVDELRAARRIIGECAAELRSEGVPIAEAVPLGVMIEIPAAVSIADLLAREADFFSIGSNDLIQYALAVDRGNEKIAHLYDPFHPAVLRLLRETVLAAREAGIPVSSCGEMSGNALGALALLGLGCYQLSVSPYQLQMIKRLIRQVRLAGIESLALAALSSPTSTEARSLLESGMRAGGLDLEVFQ